MSVLPAPLIGNIRVLLVDQQAIIRAGLRLLIGSRSGFEVSAEVATLQAAVKEIEATRPDVVLLHLDLDTAWTDPALTAVLSLARTIVLTADSDPGAHRRAIEMGAMGVVRKEQAPEMLLKAIERVHRGELWIERSLIPSLMAARRQPAPKDPEAAKIALLTEREREVVAVVAEGLRNREVGKRLFISAITVRHHLSSVFSKLEVRDRFELIIYAYRNGLVIPPSQHQPR